MDSFNYYNLERIINSKLFGLEDPDELTIEDYMKLGDVLKYGHGVILSRG